MSAITIPLSLAARLYGVSETDLRPLKGGHFAHVYGFTRANKSYILRLTPPNEETNVNSQKSSLAWMAHLAAHGAFVPAPLCSQRGNLVETIPSPDGEWMAVAFTRAEGILSEELSPDQWDESQFRLLGRAIGKMHAIARDYVPSPDMVYPDWESGGNLFSGELRNEFWLKEKQSRLLEHVRSMVGLGRSCFKR